MTKKTPFSSKQEEAIATVAKVFPHSTVLLPRSVAEEHAVDMLRALANLIRLNSGKKVSRKKLWQQMVDTMTEGVLAVGRLADADSYKK